MIEWREELAKRLTPGVDPHRVNVPSGWRKVIMEIVEKIDRLKIPWKLDRVEMKHGVLYFIPYVEIDHRGEKFDSMTRIIHKGDMEAAKTCEDCGEPGECRSISYRPRVLCDLCTEVRRKEDRDRLGGTSVN